MALLIVTVGVAASIATKAFYEQLRVDAPVVGHFACPGGHKMKSANWTLSSDEIGWGPMRTSVGATIAASCGDLPPRLRIETERGVGQAAISVVARHSALSEANSELKFADLTDYHAEFFATVTFDLDGFLAGSHSGAFHAVITCRGSGPVISEAQVGFGTIRATSPGTWIGSAQ